jgi:UDP-N-acetylmuramate dehydrogenase
MKTTEQQSLRLYNTFGIDVKTQYFIRLEQPDDIQKLRHDTCFKGLPMLILGGGSNVLFRKDYPGVVIHAGFKGINVLDEDDEHVVICAAAGENWHEFVQTTIDWGYAGLENLSLIPGTVGAAPLQNIGAYGVELSDVFYELEAFDLETGATKMFDRQALQFAYRDSYFKSTAPGKFIISFVTVRLSKRSHWRVDYAGIREKLAAQGKPLTARRISDAVCQLRREKLPDPAKLGNAGSFFKNPIVPANDYAVLKHASPELRGYEQPDGSYKLSAGWLIERCGWKGRREGNAGVSKSHALVLVNYGQATGESIWRLAQDIRASVQERFGVALEAEPRVL